MTERQDVRFRAEDGQEFETARDVCRAMAPAVAALCGGRTTAAAFIHTAALMAVCSGVSRDEFAALLDIALRDFDQADRKADA